MSDVWEFRFSELITKKLKKLKKKNLKQFKIVMKKKDEIKETIVENADHYKNLSNKLSNLKRVHVDKHFVMTFRVDKYNKIVYFSDYDHHDTIYK